MYTVEDTCCIHITIPAFCWVRVAQPLVFCLVFCWSLLVLLAIVLSILFRRTASDFPLGIFWPLYCLSFFDARPLISHWVSFGHSIVYPFSIYGLWFPIWYLLAIVLSILFRYTASDFPLGIFWQLYCLSFFDIRPLISHLGIFFEIQPLISHLGIFFDIWPLISHLGIFFDIRPLISHLGISFDIRPLISHLISSSLSWNH